ncbi:MAG: ribonuclease H-like domain-containing protein [Prevotella sp.]|nr:ribonuclease H-like domain-containing protein [Prevotella sp.]
MTLQLSRPLIVFDLETTGLDVAKDRIIQIAYVKVYPDGKEKRVNEKVNPGIPIPKEVTAITGISDEDVSSCPTFKELSSRLSADMCNCDFAGFNSNHFDIPILVEEFLRAGVDFDFNKCHFIDIQTIYHKMEPRNLSAAYLFYCGREMESDFRAHHAEDDAEATYRVLLGELSRYSEGEKQLPGNDVKSLADYSKTVDRIDFAGRFIWKDMTDKDGKVLKGRDGNPLRQEVFNFGKYKGQPVAEVLRRDPNYYNWMMEKDFTLNTKNVFTRIRMRDIMAKPR